MLPNELVELIVIWFYLSQIPEEEMNLGPNDRSIHVYHFTKEIAQNQVVFQPSLNSMFASA